MITQSSQIYYINSRERTTGTNSNFSYEIKLPAGNNFDRVVCLQASIPKTYYLVQSPGNTITLTEDGKDAKITLPEGNYGVESLKTVLATQLTAESKASLNSYTYTITSPDEFKTTGTGKLTFTVSGNGLIQPIINLTDSNLYEILGFNENSINQFTANSLTSPNVINLQKESTLYIHSDICQDNESNVLQELFASNNPDFTSVVYNCTNADLYAKKLTNNRSNIFNFQLLDENDREIHLNGGNMVFTLCVFKKIDTYRNLDRFINISTARILKRIEASEMPDEQYMEEEEEEDEPAPTPEPETETETIQEESPIAIPQEQIE
jgi:hypothetical protein